MREQFVLSQLVGSMQLFFYELHQLIKHEHLTSLCEIGHIWYAVDFSQGFLKVIILDSVGVLFLKSSAKPNTVPIRPIVE